MAEFVKLGFYPVPISDGQASDVPDQIGSMDRVFSGNYRSTRRTIKREYQLRTTPLREHVSKVVEALALGRGFHWNFNEGLYSDMGMRPNTGYSVVISATTPKFGTGKVVVTSATDLVYLLPVPVAGQWFVSWWHEFFPLNSNTWHHYARNASGQNYIDGVAAAAPPNVTTSEANGILTLTLKGMTAGGVNATIAYDDLMMLQTDTLSSDTTLPAAIFSAGTAYSRLPNIALTGDIHGLSSTRSVECRGKVDKRDFVQGNAGSGFEKDLKVLTMSLMEV